MEGVEPTTPRLQITSSGGLSYIGNCCRGIDIYALKELMGHASIENTLIYAKMLPSKLVSEIKKLD